VSNDNSEQLGAFLGGSLDRRLYRSSHLDRLEGSVEDHLAQRIEGKLVAGERARHGAPPREPWRKPTKQDESDFHRLAVRRMVEQFGGATRTLDREERLRRHIRIEEEERLRVQAEATQGDRSVAWLFEDDEENEPTNSDWLADVDDIEAVADDWLSADDEEEDFYV
jgi:hypothetical protein